MKKYKNSKGVSFLFVIGSYGSFHFTSTKHSLHLCLGWFAFTIFYYDVENALAQTLLESEKESINYLHSCEKLSDCVIHSTDWNGKCFNCGEQVFVREEKQ